MKILSWNIRQGGGKRIAAISRRLASLQAEVICLSEFRNNASGQKLRSLLVGQGYRYQVVSAAAQDANSVLIASRQACDGILHASSDPVYGHALVSAHFSAFRVFSVYFPHKKKHQLFDYLLDDALLTGLPAVIVGDYNSGINHIDQKGRSFWYEDDMLRFSSLDYHDAFRHLNGDVREYSWYSHQDNGYRYDHTYVHGDLLPVVADCIYLHEWREEGLSDHSPMLLTLQA